MSRPTFSVLHAATGSSTNPRSKTNNTRSSSSSGGTHQGTLGKTPLPFRSDLDRVQQLAQVAAGNKLAARERKAIRTHGTESLHGFYTHSSSDLPINRQRWELRQHRKQPKSPETVDSESLKWDLKAYIVESLRYRNATAVSASAELKQQRVSSSPNSSSTPHLCASSSSLQNQLAPFCGSISTSSVELELEEIQLGGCRGDSRGGSDGPCASSSSPSPPSLTNTACSSSDGRNCEQLTKNAKLEELEEAKRRERVAFARQLLIDVDTVFHPAHAPKDGSGPLRVYEGTKNQIRSMLLWVHPV